MFKKDKKDEVLEEVLEDEVETSDAGVDKIDLTASKAGVRVQVEKRKESIDFFILEEKKLKAAKAK